MTRTITAYTASMRWDDDENGHPHEFPTELGTDKDVTPLVLDEVDTEDGLTVVDLAVRYFRDVNGVEPSSWPGFRAGLWYSEVDAYQHPHTGVIENRTFHLNGFTAAEELEVFERLVK